MVIGIVAAGDDGWRDRAFAQRKISKGRRLRVGILIRGRGCYRCCFGDRRRHHHGPTPSPIVCCCCFRRRSIPLAGFPICSEISRFQYSFHEIRRHPNVLLLLGNSCIATTTSQAEATAVVVPSKGRRRHCAITLLHCSSVNEASGSLSKHVSHSTTTTTPRPPRMKTKIDPPQNIARWLWNSCLRSTVFVCAGVLR